MNFLILKKSIAFCYEHLFEFELPPPSVRAPAMESNFELFPFESWLCRRSFRVNIRGSKPEKLGFHLASCNMQLLANYTKYYTVTIFKRKSLIYIGF